MPDEIRFDDPPPVLENVPDLIIPEISANPERFVPGPGLLASSDGTSTVFSLAKRPGGVRSSFGELTQEDASALEYLSSLMFWVTKVSGGYRSQLGQLHYMRYVGAVWLRQTINVAATTMTTASTSGNIYLKVPFVTAAGPGGNDTGTWSIEGTSYAYDVEFDTAYNAVNLTPGPTVEFTTGTKDHGDDTADWYLLAVVSDGVPQQRHAGMVMMLQSAVPYISAITVT